VSHQIKALEEQLGVALFERGVRTLTLTDAGAHYLEHINDIFAKLEKITEQLQVRYGRTIIRLNVPPFFANELLLPRLSSFSQTMKKPIFASRHVLCAQNSSAEADLSIVVGTGPWEGLTCTSCRAKFHCGLLARVPAGEPHRSLHRSDGKTLLLHEERRDAWERWAAGLGFPPSSPTDWCDWTPCRRWCSPLNKAWGRLGTVAPQRGSFRRRRIGEII